MTLPWPDSWLVFLVVLWPTELLVILWHELGHVVAGRLAGWRVLAWGVGVRQPWFWVRHGSAVFYLARPLTMGLTIAARGVLERQPGPHFWFILGGPLASLIGMAFGLAAWWWGARSDILVAWLFISALVCLASAIPGTLRKGNVRLDNDARLLVDIFVYGRQQKAPVVGLALGSARALTDLLTKIGQEEGAAYYMIHAAMMEIALGNIPAAKETLTACQISEPGRSPPAARLASVARALLAVEENSDAAESLLKTAADECREDATAQFTCDIWRESWRLGRGQDIRQQVDQLRQRALDAGRHDWLCWADLLHCHSDGTDDPEGLIRDLLERHARYVSSAERAHLLAITTERLAARGERDQARVMLAEARRAIADEVATISSVATRLTFTQRCEAPLQRALAAEPEVIPLLIPGRAAEVPEQVKPLRLPPVSRGSAFGRATRALGIVTLIAAVAFALVVDTSANSHHPRAAGMWYAVICLLWLLSLFTTCVSLLRSERRYGSVALGATLATLGIALAVSLGMASSAARQRDWTRRQSEAKQAMVERRVAP